jgi:hypothetical protein
MKILNKFWPSMKKCNQRFVSTLQPCEAAGVASTLSHITLLAGSRKHELDLRTDVD